MVPTHYCLETEITSHIGQKSPEKQQQQDRCDFHRQIDRQTNKWTDNQAQTDRQTEISIDRQLDTPIDRQRQIDSQTTRYRQTDRDGGWIDKQIYIQIQIEIDRDRYRQIQRDRWTDRQIDTDR